MAEDTFTARTAALLVEAADVYLAFADELPRLLEAESDGDEEKAFSLLRRLSLELATSLAAANRVIDDSRISGISYVDGQDPRPVQPLLRALGESFVLLASARSRDDLSTRPLIAPTKLRRAIEQHQVRNWVVATAGTAEAEKLSLAGSGGLTVADVFPDAVA